MKKLSNFKTVIKISLFSLLIILMTGVNSFSGENQKSNKSNNKKVSEEKNDSPRPLVDETPINPKSVSKGNKDNSDTVDSSDTSSNQKKTKKKKK